MTVEYGSAVVMVTNEDRVIEKADRLLRMIDGRIVSDLALYEGLRICEFLKTVDAFKALTPTEVTNLAENTTNRRFVAGDVIIRKGDPGSDFFLIRDGNVDVIRKDHKVATLGRGDCFGSEAALISGQPGNATVVARTDLETCVLPRATMVEYAIGAR
jgi:putative ABC transport system ATP-binding protein